MNLKHIAKGIFNWCKANPQIFITGLGIASSDYVRSMPCKGHPGRRW